MKSLGIYGDSYADVAHGHPDNQDMAELGWPCLLKKWYNVEIYGKGGSSIYYSYKKFLETYEQHDKIVFIATDYNRWFTPIDIHYDSRHFNSVFTIDSYLKVHKYDITGKEMDILNALRSYYLEFGDSINDFNIDINNLFLKKITKLSEESGKEIIIIFTNHLYSKNYYGSKTLPAVMLDYYNLFLQNFATELKGQPIWGKYYESRCVCHMSGEVNEVLANDIHFALENNKWNPILPKQIKHDKPLDYYFTKL